jgi:hypothetical protein
MIRRSSTSVGRPPQRSGYVQAALVTVTAPDGHTYTVRYYELRPGLTTRNGFYLTNGQREQEFKGASITPWMLHGNVSYWKWKIPAIENQYPILLAETTDLGKCSVCGNRQSATTEIRDVESGRTDRTGLQPDSIRLHLGGEKLRPTM